MGPLDRLVTPSASSVAQGLGTLFKAVAFLLRPRVFAAFLALMLFIAIGAKVHAAILIPVALGLMYWAIRLRLRDQ